MQTPSYLLAQPAVSETPDMRDAFERLFTETAQAPLGRAMDYSLPFPKWQYLTYIGEHKDVVFHGSCHTDVGTVEPRQAQDMKAFSAQRAIYGTTDGIFAIFFAILDRQQYPMSLCNTCIQVRLESGQLSAPLYFFSITQAALAHDPWCRGAVYILPREHFEREPPQQHNGIEIVLSHWVGTVPVQPLARMIVGPEDLPFLAQIRGHDDDKIRERALADPAGFPWLDNEQ